MNRLLRVVLPGWWGWLLALLVLRGFALGMDWMTVRWEGHTEHVGRVGYFLTAFAAGVYGIYRVAAFHPGIRPGYLGWLKTTCWRSPQPLPLGPIHWVIQDHIIVGNLFALEYVIGRLGLGSGIPPLVIVLVFGIANLAVLGLWLRATNQIDISYAVGFGIGLSLWFALIGYGLAVLGITYLVALVGLRRSLAEFPWDSPREEKLRQNLGLKSAESRIVGADSLGWPFGHFLKVDGGPLSYRECVWLSLLPGWWCAVAAVRCHEDNALLLMWFATAATNAFAVVRIMTYIIRFTPPISLFGRLFTFRWIIPSYDKVFVAPVLSVVVSIATATLIGWQFYKPLSARKLPPMVEFLIPLPLVAGLLVLFCVGPSLRNWQLTGGYRMRRGMPQGPEARVG